MTPSIDDRMTLTYLTHASSLVFAMTFCPMIVDARFECDADITIAKMEKKRKEFKKKAPLFRLVASFKETNDLEDGEEAMLLNPTLEFLGRIMDRVMSDTVDVVGSFGQIFSSPVMEMYVMPEGGDDDAEPIEKVELGASIRSNALFVNAKDVVHMHLRLAFNAVKEYTAMFEPYRQLFIENISDSSNVSSNFESGEVDAFLEAIAAYRAQIDQFKEVPRFADVGVFFVDSDQMKAHMIPSPTACLESIKKYLPVLIQTRAQELIEVVGSMNPVIASEPSSVEAYVNKKKIKDAANEGTEGYKEKQSYLRSLVNVLDDNQWPVPDDVKASMRMLNEGLASLETNIQLADSKEEEEVKKFSAQVNEDVPKALKVTHSHDLMMCLSLLPPTYHPQLIPLCLLTDTSPPSPSITPRQRIAECREQLDTAFLADPDTSDEKSLKFLSQIEADFEKAKARTEKLQEYQGEYTYISTLSLRISNVPD